MTTAEVGVFVYVNLIKFGAFGGFPTLTAFQPLRIRRIHHAGVGDRGGSCFYIVRVIGGRRPLFLLLMLLLFVQCNSYAEYNHKDYN